MALVASVLLAAGCGGTEQGSAPAPAATIEIPPDWVAVTTVDGAMELTLPPWLIVSDTKNSIRAESLPMAPGQDSEFRVFAVEPGMTIGLAEPLRLPGEDLEAWLRRQLGGEPSAVARMTTVTLPRRYRRALRGRRGSWHAGRDTLHRIRRQSAHRRCPAPDRWAGGGLAGARGPDRADPLVAVDPLRANR